MNKIIKKVVLLGLFIIGSSCAFGEIAAAHIYHNHMPNYWPYYDTATYETTPVGGPVRYTYDGQVIKKKREGMSLVKGGMTTSQAIVSSNWPYWVPSTMLNSDGKTVPFEAGGSNNPEKYYNTPMPHDDLANDGIGPYGSGYYVHHDKRDVYNKRPPDLAVVLKSKHDQAQMHLTMSGALMNNIQSIRDEGVIPDFYPKGVDWYAPWRSADSTLKTTNGFKTFDMVHFTGHHTMGPLMGNDIFLKELIYHNTVLAQPHFFGEQFKSSKGFFPTELGFSERLIPVLDKIGVEWSVAGSTHFARCLDDYPETWKQEVGLDLNTSPPNRADMQITDPFGGTWEEREMKNSSGGYQLDGKIRPNMITTIKYPYSAIPGWVRYVNPETGEESKIAAMPVDEPSSWLEGFNGSVTPDYHLKYDTTAMTKGRKMFFGIAHDGDNNRGNSGGYSTWANAANVTYATAGVKGTGIDEYLKQNPIPSDYIIHVQDGSWADTMDSSADPTWNHWRLPMGIWNGNPNDAAGYAKGSGQWPDFRKIIGKNYGPKKTLRGGYDQYTVSFEYGYNYLERNYALLQAAVNYAKTAEQIWLDTHPTYWKPTTPLELEVVGKKNIGNQLNPWMYSYPVKGDAANDYKGGANPAELAWYFVMASIDSGFGYYDENIDDAAKPTISFNQSLFFSEPYVASNLIKDKTGPSIWWPQRFPYNPGSANTNKQDGWKAQYFNNTFAVYTYAYDVSGIKSMKVKVRTHRDKRMTPIENACRVYDPAAAKAKGIGNIDLASVGEWKEYVMTERDLTPDINGVKWQPTTTGLFGAVPAKKIGSVCFAYIKDYRDQLVDYYVEGIDNKGNITKSEIQQVYVGAGRYKNDGTYRFIEDINGTIEGTDPFVTDKEPPLPEKSIDIYIENTDAGNVVYQYKISDGIWSTNKGTTSLGVAPKYKTGVFSYFSNLEKVNIRYSDDGGMTWKPSEAGVEVTSGTWTIYANGTFENKAPAGITYTATVYYKGSMTHIHWRPTAGTWTVAPGLLMVDSEFAGYKKAVLNLGLVSSVEFCFNNGSSLWDSNGGANYKGAAGDLTVETIGSVRSGKPGPVEPDTKPPVLSVSVPAGTYEMEKNIVLTATDNFDSSPTIYYTIDGTEPTTTSGIKYSTAIIVTDKNSAGIDMTIKAIALDKSGNISPVSSFEYIINKTEVDSIPPVISVLPQGGTYSKEISIEVIISDNMDINPIVYYTVDGTVPTILSKKYTGKIESTLLPPNFKLNVLGIDKSGNKTQVLTNDYVILRDLDMVAPVVSVSPDPSLIYNKDIIVTITATDDKTKSPTIYYTIDGSLPKVYKRPILLSNAKNVLKVIAYDNAKNVSQEKIYEYEIQK